MIFLTTLAKHYQNYYAYGQNRLKYVGLVGTVGYPLFYILYTKVIPQPYENLSIRIVATILCVFLALKDYWPRPLKPHFINYSYWVVLYCLPFFHAFMSLKNHGNIVFIADSLMAVFFLTLSSDWRNTIVMLLIGGGLGTLLYVTTTADPMIPVEYVSRVPTFLLIIIGGSLFKFSEKQVQAEKIRATTALASSIAHEMRNPLGQIKSSLDRIEHVLPVPTTQAANKFNDFYPHVAAGKLAIKRGLQIIAMILDEAKAKAISSANFIYLDAHLVMQKAIDEYGYETDAERSKLKLELVRNFTFYGDETLIIFVLFNLIKNALHYFKLKPGATITITINQPTIVIRDTGPGISADRVPHLFGLFSTSGKADGTGLGLAYCKRVMSAFGGDIFCHSVVGEYTEFILHFPTVSKADLEKYQKNNITQARHILKNKHILIVDDDHTAYLSARYALQNLAAHIDHAENGEIALSTLAMHPYDAILMDINMPVLDGYAATAKIRAGTVPGYENVPIIAYTTELAYMMQIKAQKAGMDGFVSKPCSDSTLIQTLTNILAKTQAPHAHFYPPFLPNNKSVLIADDSNANRHIIKTYLAEWGIDTFEAEHGVAVIDQLASGIRCNAILMDIHMPGMDGLQATQAIRSKDWAYRTIPIIAITADTDEISATAAYSAGINDFITKPMDIGILYQKLIQHLQTETQYSHLTPTAQPLIQDKAEYSFLFDMARLEICKARGLFKKGKGNPYSRQIKEWLAILDASVDSRDFKKIKDALHFIKGSSANIGAKALSELVTSVDKKITSGDSPYEGDWLQKIKHLHIQTESALQAYIKSEN